MKILTLGDLHGDMDTAMRLAGQHRPDLLLSPGDWGDPGVLTRADWEGLLARVPVLTVYGNHDDPDLLGSLENRDGAPVLLRNGAVEELLGLRVAGINGIWAKSHRKPYYVTDEDVEALLPGLHGADVLVTHGCPQGVVDRTADNRHGGQRCFLAAFKALSPRLYLCGHLHRRQSHHTKDGALLLNSGDGRRGEHYLVEWHDGAAEIAGPAGMAGPSTFSGT